MHRITLIPGDGIGPEVTRAARDVVLAAGAAVEFEEVIAGQHAEKELGTPLPRAVFDSIDRTKIALKGPTQTPFGGDYCVTIERADATGCAGKRTYPSIAIALRRELGLFASVRPAKNYPAIASRFDKVDLVIFRENSEDLYVGIERMVDALCMELVMHPEAFDCLLLPNLYGDIVSDLAAGLVGGLGVAPGANFGAECAMFEAVHGTAPDIAGKDIANPMAMILSAVMLLRYIGEAPAADRIEAALAAVLREGRAVTRDLGGQAGTRAMTGAIVEKLQKS